MNFGIVDWYDSGKGFGVIKSIDQKEVFLHKSQLFNSGMILNQGDIVCYGEGFDQRKKRATAQKCEKLKKEHLKSFFEFLISKNISYKNLSTLLKKISTIIERQTDLDVIIFNIFNENSVNFKCIELINALTLTDEIIKYIQYISKNLIQPMHWVYALTEKKYETLNQLINGKEKYEIPEEILIQHVNSITPEWFKTLSAFSYFNNFLNDYINSYSTNTEWLDSKQCYETYRYLEQNGYNDLFEKLEGTLVNHIQIKLDTLNTQYSKITNIREYEYLKDDVNQLFKYSEILEKKYFKNIITQLVANSSNSDVKLKAYIDLYIDNLAFDEIIDIFKNRKNYEEFPKALIKLLLTISPQQQIELIFNIIDLSPVERLNFIVEFIADYENTYASVVVEHLSNRSYWTNKDSFMIIEHIHDYIANKLNENDKLELLLLGFVNRLELTILINHIDQLSDKLFYQCISQYTHQEQFTLLKDKLDQLISFVSKNRELNFNGSKYNKIENYYLAKDYVPAFTQLFNHTVTLTDDQKYQLELNAYENININFYVELWKKNIVKKLPFQYILDICKDSKKIIELDKLISSNLLTFKDIQTLVLPHLLELNNINSRATFYESFSLAKIILKPELFYQRQEVKEYINIDKELINSSSLLNLYSWILGQSVDLNYSLLKEYVLFFDHDDQMLILKKLFDFKLKGLLNFNISFIYDLFLDHYSRSNSISKEYDLNQEIIICYTVLNELIHTQKIPSLEKIIRSIIEHPFVLKDKPLNLDNLQLFDKCEGRTYVSNEKQNFGSINQSFSSSYSVRLSYKIYHDGRYIDNEHFEDHKNFLKNDLNGKWNSYQKSWDVNRSHEKALMEFALTNKFEVDIVNHSMNSGEHLRTLAITSRPNNILFCEGRIMPEKDQRLGIPYWWCAGKACYSNCIQESEDKEWFNFKLIDFIRIFNLSIDEINRVGDHIQKSQFLKLVGIINRAIGMVKKLKCDDCNHIIFPEHVSHLGASNFVRFSCVNNGCSNNETIYLNHCLHSNCKNVIDSRISKKCSNGLYICNECGTCCSTEMFKRRLDKLERFSDQNNDSKHYVIQNLKEQIFNNLGHYELVKYYCYKCADPISNIPDNGKLKCHSCDIEYNVKKIFPFSEYSGRFSN